MSHTHPNRRNVARVSKIHNHWVISRADREPVDGDMLAWHAAGSGKDPDWSQVDGYDHTEPTEYIAERVVVREVRHRTFGDGDGEEMSPDRRRRAGPVGGWTDRQRLDHTADAIRAVSRGWQSFSRATSPMDAAEALLELSTAVHNLTTWHPGYDYETETLTDTKEFPDD